MMFARTSTSLVAAFSHHARSRSIAPATSAFVRSVNVNADANASSIVSSARWMSEGAPAEKTEEEKAAIKAAREARK